MDKLYIRFGEIPKDERSSIFLHGVPVGKENGVSVYEAAKNIDGKYVPILPIPVTEDTIAGFTGRMLYNTKRCYLVKGDYIGKGHDNEPLIRNIKIIKILQNYERINNTTKSRRLCKGRITKKDCLA